MKVAPVVALIVLLAAGCSNAMHSGPAAPYSATDLDWLRQVTRWGEQYTEQNQELDPAFRDVLTGQQEPSVLRDALRPYRDCAANLRREVGEPRSEGLRKAYQLLLDACEEDGKIAVALIADAAAATTDHELAVSRASERSDRLYERAYRLIESGMRANRRLPIRGGVTAVSRIEPRLSRVAGKLAVQRVEVRCWSESEWRPMLREWNAYTLGASDIAGFVNGGMREYIAPEYCATLARFVYQHWRPSTPAGLEDVADAVELLAHESDHLLSPSADEAQVECHAVQNIPHLARALGASPSYAARLAVIYWEDLYDSRSSEYRTKECRRDGLYDLHPETSLFP
jgi:hypothetical protein